MNKWYTLCMFSVISLLLFSSCSGSSTLDTNDEYEAPMIDSVSRSGSTVTQSGSIQKNEVISKNGSEDSLNIEWPIDDGEDRMTKKTFGLQVSPKNSPVTPEKFSGFHTGIDFETTEDEQEKEIEISALCDGKLISKKWVTGYGGVAIQRCTLGDEEATVLYGHLNLESISTPLESELKTGEKLGVLGKGYSTETDDERKHLHLSIHRGESINLRGYVSIEPELRDWIDPKNYLP